MPAGASLLILTTGVLPIVPRMLSNFIWDLRRDAEFGLIPYPSAPRRDNDRNAGRRYRTVLRALSKIDVSVLAMPSTCRIARSRSSSADMVGASTSATRSQRPLVV